MTLRAVSRAERRHAATRTLHPLDEALSDLGAAQVGGSTYLVGGFTGTTYASAIVRLAATDRATTTVARLPTGTRYAGVATSDGKIYAAGGLTTRGESRAIYEFDPRDATVVRIGSLPRPEAHATLAALGGHRYLFGGRSVLRISPDTGAVARVATLPQPLSDPNAVTVGRRPWRRHDAPARVGARQDDRLDSVGNTTKALTKGYAIGSAALAAFLLFSAYLDEVRNYTGQTLNVDLSKPVVFVAGLLGAMLVYWFSSLAMTAVRKAASSVITEVRRQFKERPGIMQGTEDPDYAACVDIVTVGALKAMVLPGALVVLFPIVVGLVFKHFGQPGEYMGAESVAALLMVGTISGILMAGFLNNGGGAWDNAKKYIETAAVRRQALRGSQGSGGRRHGRRPVQGYRGPIAPRAHEAAQHDHAGARAAVPLIASAPHNR